MRTFLPHCVAESLGDDTHWHRVYRDQPLSAYGQTDVDQLSAILQERDRWAKRDGDLWSPETAMAPLPWVPAGLLLDFGAFRLEEGIGTADEWPRVKAVLTDELGLTLTESEQAQWTDAMQPAGPRLDRFAKALEARTHWALATFGCEGQPMAAAWLARAVMAAHELAADDPKAPCPPLLAYVDLLCRAYGDRTVIPQFVDGASL
ncbi:MULTISPECIES: hypothetical protein [Cupriavidus]